MPFQLQIPHKLFFKKAGMISSQSDHLLACCCSLAQTTTSSIFLTVILSQSTILGAEASYALSHFCDDRVRLGSFFVSLCIMPSFLAYGSYHWPVSLLVYRSIFSSKKEKKTMNDPLSFEVLQI